MQLEIFTLHILTFLYIYIFLFLCIFVYWYVCWSVLAPALPHIEPVCGQRGKVGRGGGNTTAPLTWP